MNSENQKWKEEVIESMVGSTRATPKEGLLSQIKQQINAPSIDTFERYELRKFAVILLIVLLINIVFLIVYSKSNQPDNNHIEIAELNNKPLINTFQIYE